MARRSGSPSRGSPAFGRGRSPSPSAARRVPPAPQPKALAPQQPAQVAQPVGAAPGGGLMTQVATTAAGVALGHVVSNAIIGGHRSEHEAVGQQQQQPQQMQTQQYAETQQQPSAYNNQDPCKFELEQFLSCAQSQSNDLSLCDGFNQVLRECKTRYGARAEYR